MNRFLVNILLALAWAAITGSFDPVNILVGFLLGALVLVIAEPSRFPGTYGLRAARAFGFLLFYLWEVVLSNIRVAHDVLSPRIRARPAIIAVPLGVHSEPALTLLANLVTMTPGTLSLDFSPDRRTLYVHAMFAEDPEAVRGPIIEGLERRVKEVFP